MESILVVGIILFVGFIFGELAEFIKLPKVTGYIIAGIMLNPGICRIIPSGFTEHTDLITNIALAFIVFSVGGTLLYSKIKKLGRIILSITFFEAEFACIIERCYRCYSYTRTHRSVICQNSYSKSR